MYLPIYQHLHWPVCSNPANSQNSPCAYTPFTLGSSEPLFQHGDSQTSVCFITIKRPCKTQAGGLKISESEIKLGPRICLSNKFLYEADAVGPGTALWEPLFQHTALKTSARISKLSYTILTSLHLVNAFLVRTVWIYSEVRTSASRPLIFTGLFKGLIINLYYFP